MHCFIHHSPRSNWIAYLAHVFGLVFLVIWNVQASEPPGNMGFPIKMMLNGDFSRAEMEFERVAPLQDDLRNQELAGLLAAECRARVGDYKTAIQMLLDHKDAQDVTLASIAILRAAECVFDIGDPSRAREILGNGRSTWSKSELSDVGDILVVLSYFKERDFTTARLASQALSLRTQSKPVKSLMEVLARSSAEAMTVPRISRSRATLLSAIIPGAGQYYSGYKSDGKVALATILTYAVLANNAHNSGHDQASVVFGTLGAGLWVGNIYGGHRAAVRRNETVLQDCISETEALAASFISNSPPEDLSWVRNLSPVDKPSVNEEDIWEDILCLFRERKFRACGTELRRFEYYFPQSTRADKVTLLVPLCSSGEGQFEASAKMWESAERRVSDAKLKQLSQLGHALSKFYNEDYESALGLLDGIARTSPTVGDLSIYLAIWCHLARGEFERSDEATHRLLATASNTVVLENVKRLQVAVDSTPRPKLMDIELAKKLSRIVPGTGQMYAGDIKDGLVSLALNLTLANQTRRWWNSDFKLGSAFLLWQGCLRFYRGNVYNAATMTSNENDRRRQAFLETLERSQTIDLVSIVGECVVDSPASSIRQQSPATTD